MCVRVCTYTERDRERERDYKDIEESGHYRALKNNVLVCQICLPRIASLSSPKNINLFS